MAKKTNGSKVDWLREMREKDFDESTRPPTERPDSNAKRERPKKGNQGRRAERSMDIKSE